MSSPPENAQMNLYTMTRMALTLGPGLGFLLYLHSSTIAHRPDIADFNNRIRDVPINELSNEYDFIIVGGGSAGCVLANRLSEIFHWNILLLEAGPDEMTFSDMPLLFPTLQLSPIDWQYKSEPNDNYCLSMMNGQCNWPRGKVLGGCSTINAMLYVRGNKNDYNRWAQYGNPGWSYDDVLPYFKKSENMKIDEYRNDFYHGKDGYLTIENFRFHSPISKWILKAAESLGYPTLDINGPQQTGFTMAHGTLRDGLRCSTAKAFLRPVSKRPNLHISLHTMAEKILINNQTKQAYGLIINKFGMQRTIYITREIIVSAGAVNSPQLLMLSGIGPKNDLDQLGIEVMSDLKVGYNLQDHVAMGGLTFLFDRPIELRNQTCGFILPQIFTTETINDFVQKRNGPMYWLPECEVIGFVNTKYQDPQYDWPDIQYFVTAYADNTDGGVFGKKAISLSDEFYAAVYEEILFQDAFNIIVLLLRPNSRGRIVLKDNNPNSQVLIYPNYYEDPHDLDVLIEGAKMAHDLATCDSMTKFNVTFNYLRIPACKEFDFLSDEYWACQAKHYTLTIYHPSGTCKMGPETDPEAVVNPRLQVYGIGNLRVIDASIMPFIPSGNTNAPVIMVAEKGADLIKENWRVFDGYYQRSSEKKKDEEEELQKVHIEDELEEIETEDEEVAKQKTAEKEIKKEEAKENDTYTKDTQYETKTNEVIEEMTTKIFKHSEDEIKMENNEDQNEGNQTSEIQAKDKDTKSVKGRINSKMQKILRSYTDPDYW